jgi:hypothetical protein
LTAVSKQHLVTECLHAIGLITHELLMNLRNYFPGWYWIDPNQGSHEDAEEVYCDFEHNATCLEPVQNKVCRKTRLCSGEINI